MIRMENDILSEMITDYETGVAKAILKLKPQNETEYKLAKLQSEVEHSELKTDILKKQNEIDSLEQLLGNKHEVAEAYYQFKQENKELLDLLDKIFGE